MSDILHHFVDIRSRLMSPDVVEEKRIEGTFALDATLLSKLKALAREGAASEIAVINGEEKEVHEIDIKGQAEVDATLFPLKLPSVEDKDQRAHYFETMDELVERFESKTPQREYYVHGDVRSFSSGPKRDPKIDNYEDTVSLIGLLSSLAAFEDSRSEPKTLYFFQDSKIKVPVKYEGADISELADLDQLKAELNREDEKDTREEVFVNHLVDELRGVAVEKRFRHILQEFDSICHQYRQGHQRYLQNFSYEKLKSSFIKDRASYLERLNRVVTEVQNKLITIPLGLLLVGGQLNAKDPYSGVNFVIAFGAIVLTVMMHLLINNQKNLLGDIKEEIQRLDEEYQERETDRPKLVQEGFESLKSMRKRQAAVLDLLSGFVWMFLATTLVLWLHYLLDPSTTRYPSLLPLGTWAVFSFAIGCWFRVDQAAKALWQRVA